MSKNLYIISGCNGAGKTTASYSVLPKMLDCLEFVNADEIARGLSPFNPESVAIEAGRLMLHRIEDLLAKDETFAIETTLATKSYINLVRRAQAKGYQVNVLFFWLRTPELALQRIAERVASGGHNIPEDIVRRRYVAGISNLFRIFIPEVDFWNIYDNSQKPRIQIALGGREADTIVFNNVLYQELQTMSNKEVQALAEKIREGLEIAEREMLEEKALRGQDIVVCDDNNNIQRIPASQLL